MPRRLYIDTETTGFGKDDRIVEIAVLDADGEVLLSTLVDPERPIPRHARAVHGISDAEVRGAPRWRDLEPDVARLLECAEIVGHGLPFDVRMIGPTADRASRRTCTLALCRTVLGKPLKLGPAAALAGHASDGRAHRAAADALACRAVHLWLLDRLVEREAAAPAAPRTGLPAPIPSGAAPPIVVAGDDPRLVRLDPAVCPPPTLRGAPWTPQAVVRLETLWRAGAGVLDILAEMPRSPAGIFSQLQKQGLVAEKENPYRDALRR